ncbi:putative aminomethyl transferase [Lasiosphaeria hispida]|uniref:Iron-sulfur cluster assembly factor IBA57 homolog, mitochondrial n=1 Tax=Lasiosphaeria hispida TaxID=260671 RepID=A0AAJ0HLM2_9PEZI|nr:putative aminomethyl transferase [Lasiosphaeria hispida]
MPLATAAATATAARGALTPVVFRRCLSPSRPLTRSPFRISSRHLSQLTSIPDPPPNTAAPAGLAPLSPARRLISITGSDAATFLQRSITANILTHTGPGVYTAFLTARGRILNDVFIYRDTAAFHGLSTGSPETSFLIEVDAAEAVSLEARIKRYKLRSKIEVRILERGEAAIWHAWGCPAPPPTPQTLILADTRAPGLGYRLVMPLKAKPRHVTGPLPPRTYDAYRLRRILAGVPEGAAELPPEEALPLESNLDVMMDAIDFHKGCYVGQELTIRTRHQGVVRKRILPVVLYAEGEAVPEALAYQPGQFAAAGAEPASIVPVIGGGRPTGKFLGGVGNVGLALCRLQPMTDLKAPPGSVQDYDPAAEFCLAGDEGTRVKAFVPEWLRQALG